MSWGISIGGGSVSLPSAGVEGLTVEWRSLESDILRWQVRVKDPARPVDVPRLEQQVTLYKGSSQVFTGIVTKREFQHDAQGARYQIECENAWYQAKKIMISSSVKGQDEKTLERTIFVFPPGNVANNIRTLAVRAIVDGVPMSVGSIDSGYEVPRMTLRNMSYADAFAQLMKFIPDGVMSFSYGSTPALEVKRRGQIGSRILSLDKRTQIISEIAVNPRPEKVVHAVEIQTARKVTHQNRRVIGFQKFQSGGTQFGKDKLQRINLTGPEQNTFLPREEGDSIKVMSRRLASYINVIQTYEKRLDNGFLNLFSIGVLTRPDLIAGNGSTLYSQNPLFGPPVVTNLETKLPLSTTAYPYWLPVLEPFTIKEWLKKDRVNIVMAEVKVTVWWWHEWPINKPEPVNGKPRWIGTLGASSENYLRNTAGPNSPLNNAAIYYSDLALQVPFTNANWPTLRTILKREDYGFQSITDAQAIHIASNLEVAQNWLPYSGRVVTENEDAGGENYVGWLCNIQGSAPELATMRAPVSSQTVTPATGQITYGLGPPPSEDFKTLANAFRPTGNDNIVWLRDADGYTIDQSIDNGSNTVGNGNGNGGAINPNDPSTWRVIGGGGGFPFIPF
jgi:hypothetical protein